MKLMMITTYTTPTNMRRELLESVAAHGHEVVVVSPAPSEQMAAPVRKLGGTYVEWAASRTTIDPVGDIAAASRLCAIARRHRPDVVLIYQIKAVLLAPTIAKLARVRNVVALVNGLGAVFDDHGFGLTRKARVARALYRLSLRNVDTVVFQNADDPLLLERKRILGRDRHRVIVPGSGVDTDKLRPPATRPLLPPTFTLMTRLLVSKGVRDYVAAARAVKARYPHAIFRLAGQFEAPNHPDGIAKAEVDAWVRDGVIDYVGFINDVPELLATTTVFVLPSYYREGVPRTSLEAMAMGLPVVTTDSVGCRDTVEDGVTGFLIPPKNAAALADRLERYLAQPGLAAAHGRASRQRAERMFDIQRVNRLMLEALGLTAGA